MAELKTKMNNDDVFLFVDTIENDKRKADAKIILDIMSKATNKPPKMWGKSIVGFGQYHYKYDSGREGDWFMCGFSPRIQSLTIYLMRGFGEYDRFLEKLGKYSIGKSCLYIKKIEDVDLVVLTELITQTVVDITNGASVFE